MKLFDFRDFQAGNGPARSITRLLGWSNNVTCFWGFDCKAVNMSVVVAVVANVYVGDAGTCPTWSSAPI